MSKSTIYLVTSTDKQTGVHDGPERLVKTTTANIAERHVIRDRVSARRAKAEEVADLMGRGVKVETPGEERE